MDQFLTPEEWNIDNLFKGKYIIPIYQRPYSWGESKPNAILKSLPKNFQKVSQFFYQNPPNFIELAKKNT